LHTEVHTSCAVVRNKRRTIVTIKSGSHVVIRFLGGVSFITMDRSRCILKAAALLRPLAGQARRVCRQLSDRVSRFVLGPCGPEIVNTMLRRMLRSLRKRVCTIQVFSFV
jgi:hypothetical protein